MPKKQPFKAIFDGIIPFRTNLAKARRKILLKKLFLSINCLGKQEFSTSYLLLCSVVLFTQSFGKHIYIMLFVIIDDKENK